ncbi:hypothetical protein [Psychroflexus tropicus]|uniref:hypothetical protein n=1 Tax=Psychroflexus tropicus TaxID=197345 RepID=UPI00035D67BC|nr:hypothetical protein [Psychroflexus tropicus]
MNLKIQLFRLFMSLVVLSSCSNDDDNAVEPPLSIFSVDKTIVKPGDELVITGQSLADPVVSFGIDIEDLAPGVDLDPRAEIISFTDHQLIVRVPENAVSGPIYIYSENQKAKSVIVRVQYPFLTGLLNIGEAEPTPGAVLNRDFGYEFRSAVNGKITEIGLFVQFPETYQVSLWDVDNRLELVSFSISSTVTGNEHLNYVAIEPYSIVANKSYRITLSRPVSTNFLFSYNEPAAYRDLNYLGAYVKDAFFPETKADRFTGIDFVFLPDL